MERTFTIPTTTGETTIFVGQRYAKRPELSIINTFQSFHGYATWCVAVAKEARELLNYKTIEIATKKAMALVATGSTDALVQEVA